MQWPLCHKRKSRRRAAVAGVLLTVGRDSLQLYYGNVSGEKTAEPIHGKDDGAGISQGTS